MTATEGNFPELAIQRLYASKTPCVASVPSLYVLVFNFANAHGLISHK